MVAAARAQYDRSPVGNIGRPAHGLIERARFRVINARDKYSGFVIGSREGREPRVIAGVPRLVVTAEPCHGVGRAVQEERGPDIPRRRADHGTQVFGAGVRRDKGHLGNADHRQRTRARRAAV